MMTYGLAEKFGGDIMRHDPAGLRLYGGDIDTSRRANYNGTYHGLPITRDVKYSLYHRHALAVHVTTSYTRLSFRHERGKDITTISYRALIKCVRVIF